MRKFILYAVIFTTAFLSAQDREINVGINGGIPIGNIESQSSFAFGANANYLVDIFSNIKGGPMIGAVYFSSKTVDGVSSNSRFYLPIGVSGRLQALDDAFFIGLDTGYAIGLSPSGDRGGIFFKPMVGYNINNDFRINLFYSGIKKRNPTYGYIGLGLSYNIFGNGGGSGYYSY